MQGLKIYALLYYSLYLRSASDTIFNRSSFAEILRFDRCSFICLLVWTASSFNSLSSLIRLSRFINPITENTTKTIVRTAAHTVTVVMPLKSIGKLYSRHPWTQSNSSNSAIMPIVTTKYRRSFPIVYSPNISFNTSSAITSSGWSIL